jgi:hypothetical protein
MVLFAHAASSPPAPRYPDHLLDFRDTGFVASTHTRSPVYWLDNASFLVNAVAIEGAREIGRVDLLTMNLATGQARVVAQGATLVCWFSVEGSGVVHLTGSPTTFRRALLDSQGKVRVTDEPAKAPEDCMSRQYFQRRGTAVTDLGRGAGVIVVERVAGQDVSSTYIQEDGTRIPLAYPEAHFGGSATYTPWLGEYSVGKAPGGYLGMRKDGTVRLDTSDAPLQTFFKGPAPVETKNGYVVHTGVWDPFNGDTFFVPTGGTPVRIYRSKGAWDQIGTWSVAPDGCGVLLSMAADGPLNRVLAYANRATQTLHYVDVCAAFPSK